VWHRIVEEDLDFALILEDDVVPLPHSGVNLKRCNATMFPHLFIFDRWHDMTILRRRYRAARRSGTISGDSYARSGATSTSPHAHSFCHAMHHRISAHCPTGICSTSGGIDSERSVHPTLHYLEHAPARDLYKYCIFCSQSLGRHRRHSKRMRCGVLILRTRLRCFEKRWESA
jgi:GR25 family glycosyltransferase involved in LPS biosynthesis